MKKFTKNEKATKTYPSTYGSHGSMLSDAHEEFNATGQKMVICKDERGYYITDRKTLDNGWCDRKRIAHTLQREQILKEIIDG